MQPVPVIPCREETTARVDVLRASAPTARRSVGALMHGQSLPNEDTRECLGRSRRPSEVRRQVILRFWLDDSWIL